MIRYYRHTWIHRSGAVLCPALGLRMFRRGGGLPA